MLGAGRTYTFAPMPPADEIFEERSLQVAELLAQAMLRRHGDLLILRQESAGDGPHGLADGLVENQGPEAHEHRDRDQADHRLLSSGEGVERSSDLATESLWGCRRLRGRCCLFFVSHFVAWCRWVS